jgi:hypothetical protein
MNLPPLDHDVSHMPIVCELKALVVHLVMLEIRTAANSALSSLSHPQFLNTVKKLNTPLPATTKNPGPMTGILKTHKEATRAITMAPTNCAMP